MEENNVSYNFWLKCLCFRRSIQSACRSFGDNADFCFIGLIFFAVAYGILSRIFHIHKEIEEDQNTALGLVIGSIMIGIAIIIAAAIHG